MTTRENIYYLKAKSDLPDMIGHLTHRFILIIFGISYHPDLVCSIPKRSISPIEPINPVLGFMGIKSSFALYLVSTLPGVVDYG